MVSRHIPDGILKTEGGDVVIEVELTQKKSDEIYKKMKILTNAFDLSAMSYAYASIRYYTADPGVKKALEVARDHLTKHNRQRAELVEIEWVSLE